MDIKKFFYINTFKDRRDRMVYFDHLKNNAFRIPKEEEAKFKTFQGRGLYSVAIFFLLYSYGISTLQMLLISIGFYILTSAYFYLKMIPTYKIDHNFDLKESQASLKDKGRVPRMLLMALYVASIFLIIYIAARDKDSVMIIVALTYSLFAAFKVIQSYFIIKR